MLIFNTACDIKGSSEYFLNNSKIPTSVYVAIADNTAEEILMLELEQGLTPSEALLKMIENGAENGELINISIASLTLKYNPMAKLRFCP